MTIARNPTLHLRAAPPGWSVLLGLLAMAASVSALGPSPSEPNWWSAYQPPLSGLDHLLGTDALGRDLLARTAHGVLWSAALAAATAGAAMIIGLAVGAAAGLGPSWMDELLMRGVDVLDALPLTLIVILLASLFGESIWRLLVVMAAVSWLDSARVLRMETLRVRREPHSHSDLLLGMGVVDRARLGLMPILLPTAIALVVALLPRLILLEALISFLGFGAPEPSHSLGVLLSEGVLELESASWLAVIPGTALVVLTWSASTAAAETARSLVPDAAA